MRSGGRHGGRLQAPLAVIDGMNNASFTERLLLKGEEYGVYELDVLEVIVDHVVEFESLRASVSATQQSR